ncbi:MAG: HAD family hydrolase [Eubacteriales bacterium]
MSTKVNTILFDLDGTLLPMDMDLFMKIYFGEMAKDFEDIIDKDTLIKCIWTATQAMVKNTENRSNEAVFMDKFGSLIKGDLEVYKERFYNYYDNGFHKAKEAVKPNEWINKSVDMLIKKGYKLVVATNPLFPEKAVHHRIRWANLEPDVFSYIASYENNNYCKPQLHYYKEILESIGKTPSDCIMVGNDVQEDLVVRELGMPTYLIEDYMIDRKDKPVESDYKGSYEDFYKFTCDLPKII